MKNFDITFEQEERETDVVEVHAVGRYTPPTGAPMATNESTFLSAPEPGEMEIESVTVDGQPVKEECLPFFEPRIWEELGY